MIFLLYKSHCVYALAEQCACTVVERSNNKTPARPRGRRRGVGGWWVWRVRVYGVFTRCTVLMGRLIEEGDDKRRRLGRSDARPNDRVIGVVGNETARGKVGNKTARGKRTIVVVAGWNFIIIINTRAFKLSPAVMVVPPETFRANGPGDRSV